MKRRLSHWSAHLDLLLPRISVPRGGWESCRFGIHLDRLFGKTHGCSTEFGENVQISVQCQGDNNPEKWVKRGPVILPFAKVKIIRAGKICPLSLLPGWQGSQPGVLSLLKVLAMGQDFTNCRVLWPRARQTWVWISAFARLAMWPWAKKLISLISFLYLQNDQKWLDSSIDPTREGQLCWHLDFRPVKLISHFRPRKL